MLLSFDFMGNNEPRKAFLICANAIYAHTYTTEGD